MDKAVADLTASMNHLVSWNGSRVTTSDRNSDSAPAVFGGTLRHRARPGGSPPGRRAFLWGRGRRRSCVPRLPAAAMTAAQDQLPPDSDLYGRIACMDILCLVPY
jgi:hypothetical protein